MSMEARVEQFHTDAMRPKDAKTPKTVQKLRSFLHKNQAYRFTDREQSHLFQAVQLYVTMYSGSDPEDNPALPLLEDALKMPFTVFTTSQKKTMLKWLDKLNGTASAGGAGGAAADATPSTSYSLIDLSDSTAELMDDDGETLQVQLAGCEPAQLEAMRAAFQANKDMRIKLAADAGGKGKPRIGSVEVL